jgi:predicted nucleic acid-binding protein
VILLDTNVISELIRRDPDPTVTSFLRRQPPQTLFTASVCEAEIRYGLARMPAGRRRNDLAGRVAVFLASAFVGRIMAFDTAAAALYGTIRAAREAAGRPISVQDAMIAAIARAYGLAIATRNIDDFTGCGAEVIDPWSPD